MSKYSQKPALGADITCGGGNVVTGSFGEDKARGSQADCNEPAPGAGPNFVTNMLIPAFKLLFGHDELHRRYMSLKNSK
jgi:hypothetical protein